MTDLNTPTYAQTRRAWRDIWTATEFERELATLRYRRAQELLALYTPYLPKDSLILEAGCGPGHVVHYLRREGYPVIGLDYAPEALRPTRAIHPELPLHLGDVHHLPYAANTFGGYLSFGVVEHFEQGPMGAIREAFRVLRPGGVLILTTPHPNFVEGLLALRRRLRPVSAAPRAAYFETQYTHDQLSGFVAAAGFKVEKVAPYSHSFTFYGLHRVFRGPGYYQTSGLAELAGAVGRLLFRWQTAFECLVIGRKP